MSEPDVSVDKRAYYQRQDIVDGYDDWRFGTSGGRYVDALEKTSLLSCLIGLPRDVPILDMPCGTGRLLRALNNVGFTSVIGADASRPMLERAALSSPMARLVEADAFHTGLPDASFGVVCTLRFLFHVQGVESYLSEVARLLKPGGLFVFDTLRWTPRGLIPSVDRALGGRLFCYREPLLAELLRGVGMEMVAARRILLLPSFVYRFVPGWMLPLLKLCERIAPRCLLSKAVILARRS